MVTDNNLQLARSLGLVTPTEEAREFLSFALSNVPNAPPVTVDHHGIPTEHTFTPGLYMRTVTLIGPMIIATRVHLTEHPFVISAGECYVYDALTNEVQALVAPYHGITKPGTFRLLYVPNEVIWSTFHPTNETDPERIYDTFTTAPTIQQLSA